ncbi:MAG: acyl-CoA dehydrogenase family protein [Pseudomonadota bacterium]|nr:acyl-CoA dehydrogenase family protein [Pseudomonadota bacterium]
MIEYDAPVEDLKFLLFDVMNGAQTYGNLADLEEFTPDLAETVLTEMGKFAAGVFLPANRPGDEQGCQYDAETRSVRAPEAYQEPFRQFVDNGWPALISPVEYGGQGLPKLLGVVFDEMCAAANTSLSMYFGLTHGAIVALTKHASDELKQQYLAPLISGQWTGTMCLTEPQCGTDLGLIKTKAVPADGDNNRYRLNGNKIWITGGEHDLAENIIHLVLAKLPDAPEGTKGISLFLVPKILPNGERNGIFCTGLEHKMGINGSATCFISMEDAEGYLIGEPHQGLGYMFSMMNSARLMVGVQGLGLGEAAFQTARKFARERQQGRSPAGAQQPDQPADNILVHPDVRRMLLNQKAQLEGGRALALWVGMQLDISEHHADAATREQAGDLVDLLTPIVKSYLTDLGYQVCDQAVQTLGGSGYTRDWGIEQLLRDCRIARIYEGTNGIQALDFVGRKLPMHNGRAVKALLGELSRMQKDIADEVIGEQLQQALGTLQEALTWLLKAGMQDREQAAAAATPLLNLFGTALLGFLLARNAQVAQTLLEQGDSRPILSNKAALRDFYFREHMTRLPGMLAVIKAGKAHLMTLAAEQF